MSQPSYLWNPPPVYSLPVRGKKERVPINRLFFVGRNYHAHAVEMGRPVDKSVEVPFYFTKSPQTLVESGATVAYPPETRDYQHEMELVVVIGKPGFRIAEADAAALIYGYACGLDMTRRDLQLVARSKRPQPNSRACSDSRAGPFGLLARPQVTEPNWRYRPIPVVRAFPTRSLNVLRRKRTACGLSDGARIGQCHVISSLELNLPNSSPLSRRRCRLLARTMR